MKTRRPRSAPPPTTPRSAEGLPRRAPGSDRRPCGQARKSQLPHRPRPTEADSASPDLGISSIHAAIRVNVQEAVSIQDLKSTNGTRVNDQMVSSIRNLG